MPLLTTLLDLVPFGVIVVSPRREVLLSNPAADRVITEGTIFEVREGRLAASSSAHDRALVEAVSRVGRDSLSRPAAFSMARTNQPPVSIVIAPVTKRTGSAGSGVRKVLVLISDPLHDVSADPEILAAMFDFTPAEAAVAQHMVEGKDVNDVARDLAISSHTVRNHLRRLFSKTNTNKQTELLRALLRSPGALRLGNSTSRARAAAHKSS